MQDELLDAPFFRGGTPMRIMRLMIDRYLYHTVSSYLLIGYSLPLDCTERGCTNQFFSKPQYSGCQAFFAYCDQESGIRAMNNGLNLILVYLIVMLQAMHSAHGS
jgi:hypothetical protein